MTGRGKKHHHALLKSRTPFTVKSDRQASRGTMTSSAPSAPGVAISSAFCEDETETLRHEFFDRRGAPPASDRDNPIRYIDWTTGTMRPQSTYVCARLKSNSRTSARRRRTCKGVSASTGSGLACAIARNVSEPGHILRHDRVQVHRINVQTMADSHPLIYLATTRFVHCLTATTFPLPSSAKDYAA
jgi:hypothetical protein